MSLDISIFNAVTSVSYRVRLLMRKVRDLSGLKTYLDCPKYPVQSGGFMKALLKDVLCCICMVL